MPPPGAGPLNWTVPVDDVPPGTEAGDTDRFVRVAGFTVKMAVTELPATVAVMVSGVEVATPDVVIVKGAELDPAATVTVGGGAALGSLEERLTCTPPVGAGALRVTVPVDDVPPMTDVGLTVSLVGAGGLTVRVAVSETEP